MKKYLLALAFVTLFTTGSLFANTITVYSVADLQKAISKAEAGDNIIVANGVYTTTADINIDRKGTATQPITIAAEAIGGAEITGVSGFHLIKPATYIVIKGFKFTHASGKTKTDGGTSFCRITQNIFETPGKGEDLTIAGSDHQIDYNTFQNKNAMGRMLAVRGTGSQIAERLWIHHNYFKSYKDQGGANGAETLQFGLSGFSLSSSNSIVEHNLFEDCAGEAELISVKASAVTLRYNTIRNCPAGFTLRHGNRCLVYGNYFFNTPGLRIFGDDHVIHSNYFENCTPAINVGNGDGEVADGALLTSHDRPDRVLIAFNTLVNNKSNIIQSGRKDGMGATYITIANNIIQGGGKAAAISGPYNNGEWINNITFNVKEAGDMPATGYTTADPKLSKDASGAYHLQTGSVAIDKAKGSYPSVITDMDGQQRKGQLDIGADEVSQEKVIARILQPADVGHKAGTYTSAK
jgi:poly(beta-D-mannuronate) lyase